MAEQIIVTYEALKSAAQETSARYNEVNDQINTLQAMNDTVEWTGKVADALWRRFGMHSKKPVSRSIRPFKNTRRTRTSGCVRLKACRRSTVSWGKD